MGADASGPHNKNKCSGPRLTASCNISSNPDYVQIPTVGFLYIAGWIGYVGRDYIIAAKKESKPRDKEIIIDVPMAAKMAFQVTHHATLQY